MGYRNGLLAGTLIWTIIAATVSAVDWPEWRGPDGTGVSPERGWLDGGPRVLWHRDIGVGYSRPAVHGDMLFVAGWKGGRVTMYRLDAPTGEVVWEQSYKMDRYRRQHEGGPASSPATDGRRVYSMSREADVFCLDAANGDVAWHRDLGKDFGVSVPTWAFSGSLRFMDDAVIADVGVIAALDRETGKTIWKTRNYGPAYSSPVVFEHGGRKLVAAFPEFGLVILDAGSGREIASHRWKTSYGVNAATPIVHENLIFISSGYNKGSALLRFDGGTLDVVWQGRQMRNHMATCVLIDGSIYGFDESRLKCLDFRTGEEMWSQRGLGKGALMASTEKLVVMSDRGELVIAEATPKNFKPLARHDALPRARNVWIAPVLANGRVYCRDPRGRLAAIVFDQ